MTTSKVPIEMLRELHLTPEEIQLIIDEAEHVISETLAVNELFIANDRHLPKNEWKHVKSKEKVQVYQTRKVRQCAVTAGINSALGRSKETRSRSNTDEKSILNPDDYASALSQRSMTISSHSDSSAGSSMSSSSERNSEISVPKPAEMPLVIATGIIAGTVEDVAFGALAHTESLTRHRDAHLEDQYAGLKVLATILRPTVQDPFRSLVVKWSTKSVGALSRMRDCVYIEANGIATDSNGEQVAYNLVHSIDNIPRLPGFKHLGVVRVNMSTCYITRHYNQSSVEVFCRGFADPGGNFAESIANNVFTDMVLSVVHVVDCSYIKKLIWLTRDKRRASPTANSTSDACGSSRSCGNCATSLRVFGSLIHTGNTCQACRQEICNKCSVPKKLAMEVSSTEMKTKTVTFCLCCVIEAKQLPTRETAAALLYASADPECSAPRTR